MPGSHEIAFMHYHRTEANIVRVDVVHKLRRNLTPRTGCDSALLWSPDGETISFVSDREGRVGLFAMNVIGRRVWRMETVAASVP
jgi:Tol biopolymer transport system component